MGLSISRNVGETFELYRDLPSGAREIYATIEVRKVRDDGSVTLAIDAPDTVRVVRDNAVLRDRLV